MFLFLTEKHWTEKQKYGIGGNAEAGSQGRWYEDATCINILM
jgi:hypothetical protein